MNDHSNPLDSIEPIPDHRRNGKIAALPKAVRDRINLMMLDGLTYLEIIAELGDVGKGLNEDNLGNWKSGGYTQWLKSNEQRQTMLVVQEAIIDRALKMGRPGGLTSAKPSSRWL